MFHLLTKLLSLIHLCHLMLYAVCSGILIVSLNTKCSHFFMYAQRFKKNVGSWTFGLKSWTAVGQHVYEPWCPTGPRYRI